MKKRNRLTPFAKIVILVVVILIARYAYINREGIASGEFFNFGDTTNSFFDKSDSLIKPIDSLHLISDSNVYIKNTDTLSIFIEKSNNILKINVLNKTINILLSDSILISDTINFNIPIENKGTGRIVIK